jgi:hypothetical protein
MTQTQLDAMVTDLVKVGKIFLGTPQEEGVLKKLDFIKDEIRDYNSQKIKNHTYFLVLIGTASFFMGLSLGFYGLNKNFDIEKKELVKSEIKIEEKNDLSYLSLNDLSSISKDFKFHDNSFIYKNKIFQEGDILGNMRIEKIVPEAFVKFRDLSNGNSKALSIK